MCQYKYTNFMLFFIVYILDIVYIVVMDKLNIDEKAYWQRLKDITVNKNITLRTCCEELGFRYQSILNMHQRGSFPPVDKILEIAVFYDTTVEYLVAGITDNISEKRIRELEEQLNKISSIANS